jgi:hypothetical protein
MGSCEPERLLRCEWINEVKRPGFTEYTSFLTLDFLYPGITQIGWLSHLFSFHEVDYDNSKAVWFF